MVGQGHEEIMKLFTDLDAEDINDKALKWKKTLEMPEKDGISCIIHQRPITGRSINMCKNVTVFRGISL